VQAASKAVASYSNDNFVVLQPTKVEQGGILYVPFVDIAE
jgi:hypothetical protein